jgi:hypothetical protein
LPKPLGHSAIKAMPQGHTDPQSGRRDSNPRPSPWQGDALPTEPRPRAPGVRLRTVADPTARANSDPRFAWVRHAPIRIETRSGYRRNMTVPAHHDLAPATRAIPYDTDIAQAALIADPMTTWRAAPGWGLLEAMLGQRLLARENSKSLDRTDHTDSASTRFAVTGAGARTLASFGVNIPEVRRSRRASRGSASTGPSAAGT